MKKILITGANGFVGKRLVIDLLAQGYEVYALCRIKGALILYAGMKLPGEAWLQFNVEQKNQEWFDIQTATFRPREILGCLYWYALIPFYVFIFKK